MKRLIIVNGTMGVGKSSVCFELQKLLPKNVFLDGDWCWKATPFTVTEETKAMVLKNISFLLNSFLGCSEYKNIIFCWVLDEQETIDALLNSLSTAKTEVRIFTLTAAPEKIEERLLFDIENGLRETKVISRSTEKLPKYEKLKMEKIDTNGLLPNEAAKLIEKAVFSAQKGAFTPQKAG